MEVENYSDGRRVKNVSLKLHAGEVLGLAGLVGSGRTELARLIFGADPKVSGTLKVHGKPVTIKDPMSAISAGIVYLTEDRKNQGVFLDMSVHDNINLAVFGRDSASGGVLRLGKAMERARSAIKSLAIRVAGPGVGVGSLSGGNQQKVLLSRLLETDPAILILDEPTRGVDVGAKSEIYKIIDDLARRGAAVLVISSELPEVVGIADRVIVMREGNVMGELDGSPDRPITQESIGALAAGVAHAAA
jgi:ribose transport system ATP-binding protein